MPALGEQTVEAFDRLALVRQSGEGVLVASVQANCSLLPRSRTARRTCHSASPEKPIKNTPVTASNRRNRPRALLIE
jgi:hypothetical protein